MFSDKTPIKRIGTEREGSLHRTLKFRYTGEDGAVETPMAGYVCDGINAAGEMIEVQTGSFGPLKKKIPELLPLGPVRIIHPIVVRKSIETWDMAGQLLRRRNSPRKGNPWDLFKALIYAPDLPKFPGLTVELALVDVLEKRIVDGKGSWRRKGISITDRSITEYHETIVLREIKDYHRFLPFKKGEPFTVKVLAEKAGIPPVTARKTLYVLYHLDLAKRTGKKGNAWVYQRV
jgi:hypothetical protein